jgi:hypothetical protein
MSDGFTWMKHPGVDIPWRCPDAAVDQWIDLGHEPCDPPVEINPAIADRLAAERERADKAAAEEAAAEEAQKPAAKKAAKSDQKPEEK